MTDGIESKRGISAQLPRVKLTSSEQSASRPENKEAPSRSEAEGMAIRISFSGLGKTIQNNSQASASLNRISSGADARRDVEQANRAASEATVDEVEELASSVAEAISYSPEEAINAFNGGSYRAADLLKN